MSQSLDFAASLSSFFLCQFAAPILNLGGWEIVDQLGWPERLEEGGQQTHRST